MVKVGNFRLIFNQTILCNSTDEIWIEVNDATDNLKLNIVFETSVADDKDSSKRTVSVEGFEDHAKIVFANWNSTIAQSTRDPLVFANSDDGVNEIYLLASISKQGGVYTLNFQVMVGPKNGN